MARNVDILEARVSGDTYTKIAVDYEISPNRARQIAMREVKKARDTYAMRARIHELTKLVSELSRQLKDYEQVLEKDPGGYNRPLSMIEMSVRSHNALRCAGLKTWGEVAKLRDYELLRIPNFGRKSLNEVRATCMILGLTPSMQRQEIE